MGKAQNILGDKFTSKPGDFVVSQCTYCAHFLPGSFAVVCPAFPGGIPRDIWENRFDHRSAHPDEYQPVRLEFRDDVPGGVVAAAEAFLDKLD